jgi:hypothetical protein
VEVGVVTFIVEVGFTAGAGVDPSYLRLDDPVAGLLDVGLLAPDGLFTDLSTNSDGQSRVMDFTVDRSSSQGAGALVEYAAGTLSLTLLDDNGDLDPANIAEPIPGVAIQFSKVWAGNVYPLFTGTIDSWEPEHRYPDQAVIQVTATDNLGKVGGYSSDETAAVGASDLAGARINRFLDAIVWPTGQRDIDTGTVTLSATSLEGNTLDNLRNTAQAEVGQLYATAGGDIRFVDRKGLILDAASLTVQATFGSNRAAGELPWAGMLGISYSKDQLINLIRAQRDGGTTVFESSDEESRSRYGDHSPGQFTLPLETDDQVSAWTDYVRARDSRPKLVFTDVTIDVRADEDNLYPQVLTRDFGDRIAVVRRPPGVAADTREAYIRGIHHSFQAPLQWQTRWELEPASTDSPFILDDAVRGLLDNANVLAY